MKTIELYRKFAKWASDVFGSSKAFSFSVLLIILWLGMGPFFGYSDTWQLVINTFTSVVTYLIVFIIQNSQNRGITAIQIKLDELIRANEKANNTMLDLEDSEEEYLEKCQQIYRSLKKQADVNKENNPDNELNKNN